MRRLYAAAAGLAALAAIVGTLRAQAAEPAIACSVVRFVHGGAPGTVTDISLRQMAGTLSNLLGRPVVVDNRASAGGIRALEILARSPPDGCTLSLVNQMQMSVAPSLFKALPYSTLDDFAPVGVLWRGPQVLVANAGLGVDSLPALLALARSHPDRLRYGSPGVGTPTHVEMESFKLAAGIELTHVPYRGAALYTAVLAGEVQLTLDGLAPLLPHIRSGRVRALAVTGTHRLGQLPDVPSFQELGLAGMSSIWVGVVAPRGTPPAVLDGLHVALDRTVESPEVRAVFEAAGRVIEPDSPQAMRALIAEEIPLWRDIVTRARIGPD